MNDKDYSSIHDAVAAYYDGKLREFGATSKGVDWRDESSHILRHRQFLYLLGDDFEASVCDLGCGYGHFLTFLRAHGYRGRYIGCDISAQMLEVAKQQHVADRNHEWVLASRPQSANDYLIASGIFNVRRGAELEDWERYIFDTIDVMFSACMKGIAFNILSTVSDVAFRRDDLYYADPIKLFERCASRYGRHIALLQDTQLYEFTLVIRKE
ncbi:MAG: class I SAM-dependent methyltransferase [Rhodospirillaceae bacterium]|nr:MAG: class I SAM-dependent methyltransferase [Rhodospirillaceae bacterium]